MRTRRELLLSLSAGLLLPLHSLAQPKEKLWRVGFLSARSRPQDLESDYHGGFPRGLRELGYVEGRSVVIEWRYAEGEYGALSNLAAELARLKVDAIVTADGTPSALAAQKATSTIPIVFAAAGDPVGSGLVKTLAHPGGNTTGISLLTNDTNLKQMEMLISMSPRLSRVAVLFNPTNPYSFVALKGLRARAQAMNLQLVEVGVRTREEIEAGFLTFIGERAGAMTWITDAFLIQQCRQTAELASKHKLASVGGLREFAEAGGLMSYGPNRAENYRRAAAYVDKIFKGANPGDLPVEQPTKLELILNRRTARALGREFPPELLVLADKVIE